MPTITKEQSNLLMNYLIAKNWVDENEPSQLHPFHRRIVFEAVKQYKPPTKVIWTKKTKYRLDAICGNCHRDLSYYDDEYGNFVVSPSRYCPHCGSPLVGEKTDAEYYAREVLP